MKRNLVWIVFVVCSLSMAMSAADRDFRFAYVANAGSNTVSVIDRATNTVVGTIGVGVGAGGAAVTHDGKELWVVANSEVDVIDTATDSVTASIAVGPSFSVQPNSVVISPDDKRVYVVNNLSASFGTVSVIDRHSHAVLANIPVGQFPWSAAITPNGKRLFVTNSMDGTVSVIDTGTLTVVYTTPPVNQTFGLAMAPDGKHVYVMALSSTFQVLVMDTATNAIRTTIPITSAGWAAFSPNGKFLYVNDIDADTVRVIDTKTNTVTATIPGPSCSSCDATGIAVGPHGRFVYSVSHGTVVDVIDSSTNTVVETITAGSFADGIAVRPLP